MESSCFHFFSSDELFFPLSVLFVELHSLCVFAEVNLHELMQQRIRKGSVATVAIKIGKSFDHFLRTVRQVCKKNQNFKTSYLNTCFYILFDESKLLGFGCVFEKCAPKLNNIVFYPGFLEASMLLIKGRSESKR
jgi:hypothetical protein